jgi:3-deoxy-D-manno-octulosonate 8-phosphate phosphatase (KDO 8-P phosphatase)
LSVRAVMLDVDGVLTDGTFWWGPNGEEWKRFSFSDVMGIVRAGRAGMLFALVSGEETPLLARFAGKTQIAGLYAGCKDKTTALRSFAEKHSLSLSEICFMGNDVNDLEAMRLAGFSAAPADAEEAVRRASSFVAARGGGRGAVRDLIEHLMPGVLGV